MGQERQRAALCHAMGSGGVDMGLVIEYSSVQTMESKSFNQPLPLLNEQKEYRIVCTMSKMWDGWKRLNKHG